MEQKIDTLLSVIEIKASMMIVVAEKMWRKICAWTKPLLKPVLTVFVIALIAMSAVLRANFTYIDDATRVVSGKQGWEDFSRHVSNFTSNFVHGNDFLSDISPWTQILAVLIMAGGGFSFYKLFTSGKSFAGMN